MIRQAALALLGGMALMACAFQITGYAQQPALTAGPWVTKAEISVVWTDDVEKIAEHCGHDKIYVGCADVYRQSPTQNWCVIWAPLPFDFNDIVRLAILGHEVFHCFGANHARN